jgi:hypothetical protein
MRAGSGLTFPKYRSARGIWQRIRIIGRTRGPVGGGSPRTGFAYLAKRSAPSISMMAALTTAGRAVLVAAA